MTKILKICILILINKKILSRVNSTFHALDSIFLFIFSLLANLRIIIFWKLYLPVNFCCSAFIIYFFVPLAIVYIGENPNEWPLLFSVNQIGVVRNLNLIWILLFFLFCADSAVRRNPQLLILTAAYFRLCFRRNYPDIWCCGHFYYSSPLYFWF